MWIQVHETMRGLGALTSPPSDSVEDRTREEYRGVPILVYPTDDGFAADYRSVAAIMNAPGDVVTAPTSETALRVAKACVDELLFALDSITS